VSTSLENALIAHFGFHPRRNERALVGGHLGDIARRHRAGPGGIAADQAGIAADMLGIVEPNAPRQWRMMGPSASTIATISQLKRVANSRSRAA
jgi:hypothetical protein